MALLHAQPVKIDGDTFASRGRALGLSELEIVEALCRALARNWALGGRRFLGPEHRIDSFEDSMEAVAELERTAQGAGARCERI